MVTVSLPTGYSTKNRGAARVPLHGDGEDAAGKRLPVAAGILQVAHPNSSSPKPGRNSRLAGLSVECYAHLARSSTRPAMSRAIRNPERLPLRWWDSPPSNCRDDAGSPLGAGDPPDYSMFQERAPGALVIGEEHFTFLGYHIERRCQAPCEFHRP